MSRINKKLDESLGASTELRETEENLPTYLPAFLSTPAVPNNNYIPPLFTYKLQKFLQRVRELTPTSWERREGREKKKSSTLWSV